jgi:hypothetical protein
MRVPKKQFYLRELAGKNQPMPKIDPEKIQTQVRQTTIAYKIFSIAWTWFEPSWKFLAMS